MRSRENDTVSIEAKPSSADGGSSSRNARIRDVGSISQGSPREAERICSGIGSVPKRSSNLSTG